MSMNIRMKAQIELTPLDQYFIQLINANTLTSSARSIPATIEVFSLYIPDSILNKTTDPKKELRIKKAILNEYIYGIDDTADSLIAYAFDMIRALWALGYDFGTVFDNAHYDYRNAQYLSVFDVCEKLLVSKHIDDDHRKLISQFAAEATEHYTNPLECAKEYKSIMFTSLERAKADTCATYNSLTDINECTSDFTRIHKIGPDDAYDHYVIKKHPDIVENLNFDPSHKRLYLDDIETLLGMPAYITYYKFESQYFKII